MTLPGQPPRFPQQPPQRPRYPQPPQGGFRQPAQTRPNWGYQPSAQRPGPGYRHVPPQRPPQGHGQIRPPQQQWSAPGSQFGRNQQWSTPAKSSGSGCGVAFGLIAAAGLGFLIFIGLVLGALINDPSPASSSSSSRSSTTSPASRYSPSKSPTAPRSSAAKPTTSRSAPPSIVSTQRTHPAGDYKNDGYRAPGIDPNYPAPRINDREHGDQVAKYNAIYNVDLTKPVRCELDVIDYDKATNEQRLQQLVKLRNCYLRVWGPLLEQAGFTMITPEIYLATPETQSPCGKAEPGWVAFFCPTNQAIYMLVDKFRTTKFPNGAIHPTWEVMFAHEFGHHLQHRTGIYAGRWAVVYDQDVETRNHSTRRNELQAQCFAGLTFQAIAHGMGFSDYDMEKIRAYETTRVTDPTHSSGRLQGLWFAHGTEHTRVGECNTYLADASLIDYY